MSPAESRPPSAEPPKAKRGSRSKRSRSGGIRRPLLVGTILVAAGLGAGLAIGLHYSHRPVSIAALAPKPTPPIAEAPQAPPAIVLEKPPAPPPKPAPAPEAAPKTASAPADPNSPPQPKPVEPPADIQIAALPPPAGMTAAPPRTRETAPLPVAPAPETPKSAKLPAWQRFAVTSHAPAGWPLIAIIIDDVGLDRKRSEQAEILPGPLTISFMAYADDLGAQTAIARAHGQELIEHVPMEPLDSKIDPGPNALFTKLPLPEIRRRLDLDLGRISGIVGINNHEGSKFTGYAPGMNVVMDELKRRGLLFVDSRTSPKSVGLAQARQFGVPAAGRDVFLDDQPDLASVRRQLALVEQEARKHGTVIAIGHPKDATLAALAAWLPGLAAKGFAQVPVSAVVTARMNAAAHPAVASRK